MYKIYLFLFFIFFNMGFQVYEREPHFINESFPTLWIKVCENENTAEFSDNAFNSLPGGDTLKNSSASVRETMQNIIDNDFNSISSSYLNIELYPIDPNNPHVGSSYTSVVEGQNRILDLCFLSANSGGGADLWWDGGKIESCNFYLGQKYKDDVRNFITLFSHELGHCLGIDHPHDTINSVLSYYRKIEGYRLMVDDRMALTYLYPLRDAEKDHEIQDTYGFSCQRRK
ncbi:MAG: matrixin family metalloprotease [Oligoflexales bacterium]